MLIKNLQKFPDPAVMRPMMYGATAVFVPRCMMKKVIFPWRRYRFCQDFFIPDLERRIENLNCRGYIRNISQHTRDRRCTLPGRGGHMKIKEHPDL